MVVPLPICSYRALQGQGQGQGQGLLSTLTAVDSAVSTLNNTYSKFNGKRTYFFALPEKQAGLLDNGSYVKSRVHIRAYFLVQQ